MLGKRIISAGIGIIILIAILTANSIFVNIGVAAISIIALYELLNAAESKRNMSLNMVAYMSALVFAFSNFIDPSFIPFFIYAYVIVMFLFILIFHRTVQFSDIAINSFAIIYICFTFMYVVLVRYLPHGNIYVWMIFLGAFTTDTFAFFAGTLLGKHKLWPEISPKKTVEGAIGGVIGCGLSFLLFGYIMHFFLHYNVNYTNLFIIGVVCSVVSQIGDLSASVIKRQYGIKDFGKIMPGHGGVMDRFDSILFAAPAVYYLLKALVIIL